METAVLNQKSTFNVLEACPTCGHPNINKSHECQADDCTTDLRIYPASTLGNFKYQNRTDEKTFITFEYWNGLREITFVGAGASYETNLKEVKQLVVYENWRAAIVMDSKD